MKVCASLRRVRQRHVQHALALCALNLRFAIYTLAATHARTANMGTYGARPIADTLCICVCTTDDLRCLAAWTLSGVLVLLTIPVTIYQVRTRIFLRSWHARDIFA